MDSMLNKEQQKKIPRFLASVLHTGCLILMMVGFFTTSWYCTTVEIGSPGIKTTGCGGVPPVQTLPTLPPNITLTNNTLPDNLNLKWADWTVAVTVLMFLSIFACLFCILAEVASFFVEKLNTKPAGFCIVLISVIAGVCNFLAVVIYGAKTGFQLDISYISGVLTTTTLDYGYSFILLCLTIPGQAAATLLTFIHVIK